MAGIIDILQMEKTAGSKAATMLRGDLRNAISRTVRSTGESRKSTVRTRFRDGRLDRLTIVTPHYIFKQHYGFEGEKKNGVIMRLHETNVLNIALRGSSVLEKLADEISNIRGYEVTNLIIQNLDGRQ